jgi:hypothetical protein
MEITKRGSNFSQFSRELWLKLNHEGTTVNFDVPEDELKDFSIMLLDVVWDSLSQMDNNQDNEKDFSNLKNKLSDIIEDFNKL